MSKENEFVELIRQLVGVPIDMLGTLLDLIRKLCGEDSARFLTELKRFVLKQPCWMHMTNIVDWVDIIYLQATTQPFVIHFVVNIRSADDRKKLYKSGNRFDQWFLDKREPPAGAVSVRYGDLTKPASNLRILAELGGEARAETSFAIIYTLVLKQLNDCKNGCLSTRHGGNLFFIRDINGILRVVRVFLGIPSWSVLVYAIDELEEWIDGYRVFAPVV